MERKVHNYTLEYKNWKFKLDETDSWTYSCTINYWENRSSMYIWLWAKTIEEAKERVENFIKTELK